MNTEPNFLQVTSPPLVPVARVAQQGITPGSVPPDKFDIPWQSYPLPAITSIFGALITAGGGQRVAAVSPAVPNAAFVLGNSTVESRFIKQGGIVRVYVKFTVGTTTVINNLTENGSGQIAGNAGVMAVNLPFPAASVQPYGVGTVSYTETVQAADNSLSHTAAVQALYLQALDPNAHMAYFTAANVWTYRPKAPATYNAASSDNHYWSAGDYMEFAFEYETDYDG